MPSFWIGLMLLYIFGVKFKIISVIGGDAGGIPILAAFAMDISFFGIMTRLIRTNMIQVLKQDYIRASRAKGLSSVNVILRHGLKNILIPVLTRLVSIVIGFFCGSAVIEMYFFSIQGIGNLALKSDDLKRHSGAAMFYLYSGCWHCSIKFSCGYRLFCD